MCPPGFSSVVKNLPRPAGDKVIYGNCLSKNGQMWVVRPEQKKVVLIKDVVHIFSKPLQLVLEAFAGKPYTAKLCQLLNKRRKCVWLR